MESRWGLSRPDLTNTPRFLSIPEGVNLNADELNEDVTAAGGYHPNDLGYKIIAERFFAAISPVPPTQ